MKTLFFFSILFFVVGCNTSKDEVQNFAPGTYARFGQDEFTQSYDTLIIKAGSESSNQIYEITYIENYQQTIDAKKLTPVYKKHHWNGVYDENKNTLTITKDGRVISFYPEENQLKLGATVYKKLK